MTRTRNIGLGTKLPSTACSDKNCPYHGNIKIRGKQFTGKVVSDKMTRSVLVEWLGWQKVPKYERYRKTKTKVSAHNPACIDAKEGDMVRIGECRPISKTKTFIVVSVLGSDDTHQLKKESLEEGKHQDKPKTEINTKTENASE
ncbi:30S ribosomal protein S17 [Candidatus Woesearchaeota archaeon]|nr:30S ribosomal protein S17 [Candidatus Woesearchaeota archaeon]